MLDITRPLHTKSGKRVIGLKIKEHNCVGNKVTYPLKGSIVIREKPLKLEYCIWTLDGIYDIVFNTHEEMNLVWKK